MEKQIDITQLEEKIISVLTQQKADFIRFVDVSGFSIKQNRGLPNAILFGIALPRLYLQEVAKVPDYVKNMIEQNKMESDELYLTELKTDSISNQMAEKLVSEGFNAYAHSDDNLIATGVFDGIYEETPLPHKTIAVLSGIGWIGKNNLLVTPEYGSALCLGVVLTDAPLNTSRQEIVENKCGKCNRCINICQENALQDTIWQKGVPRKDMIHVEKCTTCMKCLVHCPYTQRYYKQ